MDRNTLIKRLSLAVAVVVIIGALVIITISVLQPKITVIAPVGSITTVSDLVSGTIAAQKISTGPSITLGVTAGSYAVTVSNGTTKQLFYGSVSPFQDLTFQTNNTSALTVMPVARQVAFNVIQQGTAISYLDTTGRAVEQLTQSGVATALDTNQTVDSLRTAAPGRAQGLYPIAGNQAVVFSNQVLYLLSNGKLQPLNTTGMPNPLSGISIGTNPSQSSFVIGDEQTLYWYSSPTAKPQKLATLDKKFDKLAYGGNKLIIYSTRMPDAVEDIRYGYVNYAVDPIIIDTTSKTQKVLTIGPLVSAALSPDGQYAAVQVVHSPTIALFKLGGSTKLHDLMAPDTTVPMWIDGTHFVYGKDSDVWQYDVATNTATTLGTLPNGQQPTSITYDALDKVYYVTTYNSADTAAIYSLSSQAANPSASAAAALDISQQSNAQFQFSFVNITQPTLIIHTNVISNRLTAASFQTGTLQARQAALSFLAAKKIDTTKLTIAYDPASL